MSIVPESLGILNLNQTVLTNEINRLLVNNAHWTREYILMAAYQPGELDAVTDQLTQSATDIAKFFSQYYGQERATILAGLLMVYNYYAMQEIDALRMDDPERVVEMHREWSDTAEAIAQFMSEQNRNIDQSALQGLFENLIHLTEQEATQIFSGDYRASLAKYMEIISYVMDMAWDISNAISGVVQIPVR